LNFRIDLRLSLQQGTLTLRWSYFVCLLEGPILGTSIFADTSVGELFLWDLPLTHRGNFEFRGAEFSRKGLQKTQKK
jgi:hypothetical protein